MHGRGDKKINKLIVLFLNAVSLIFKSVSFVVLKIKSLRKTEFEKIKIISVDNLAFGGTGKTPLVIEIGKILNDAGIKFSIVMRGYGSKNTNKSSLSKGDDTWEKIGDEAVIYLKEFPETDIFIGSDRKMSINQSIKRGNEVVVLDDGFQSSGIKKDIKIMLINEEQPYYYLRNFKFMAESEDVVLYTNNSISEKDSKKKVKNPIKGIYSFDLAGFLDPNGKLIEPGNTPMYGFSALGDNKRFKKDLKEFNLKGFWGFRDHYVFENRDLELLKEKMNSVGAKMLVCTHKDFVKIRGLIVGVQFPLIYVKNRIKFDFDLKSYILSIIK